MYTHSTFDHTDFVSQDDTISGVSTVNTMRDIMMSLANEASVLYINGVVVENFTQFDIESALVSPDFLSLVVIHPDYHHVVTSDPTILEAK